jgi:predicted O-linked N-acetylglucosamine transferase (SPINDLY family)
LILQASGALDAAEQHCRTALKLEPRLADAHNNLGNVLKDKRQIEAAAGCYQEAIRLEPAHPLFHYNYGTLLPLLGKSKESELALKRTIELDPAFAPAYNNLGALYLLQGRLDEARQCLRRAVSFRPLDPQAFANYGLVLQRQCDLDEAHALALRVLGELPALRQALHMAIDVFGSTCDFARRESAQRQWADYAASGTLEPATFTEMLLDANYTDVFSREQLFDWHTQWASTIEARFHDLAAPPLRHKAQGDKLRIGYVSPDFREHATAYFVSPIIANHNRASFEVCCYYNHPKEDPMTERIRRDADRFVNVSDMPDDKLAQLIKEDGVDILVDLAGHTSRSRLGAFAHRQAPLQLTYLGYPNTTGMSCMDYIVTDPAIAAGGGTLYTEKPLVLPECVLTFPDSSLPARSADVPPCVNNGYVTFGSLNNLKKITSRAIKAWADILRRVESARLLIGYTGADKKITQANLCAEFASNGVDAGRLIFIGRRPREEFLRLYDSIDVLLDTFPYTGTTTTCEALWMGVPVVTLAGPAHRQRVSCSILKNAGFEDLVALTDDEYILIAVGLARDPMRLQRLRIDIPSKLHDCVVGQPERFTQQWEQALLDLWQERIARTD